MHRVRVWRPWLAALCLPVALPAAAPPAAAPVDETALTLYSSARPGTVQPELWANGAQGVPVPGFAVVRQERSLRIEAGRSQLRFTDVAALIDPTTVTFSVPDEPGTRVLEQNFQFDLVSTAKLLTRYVDRPVTLERPGGATVSGTLLSAADGLVVRSADGSITAVRDYSALRVAELPGGLITRPTLVWDLNAARGGTQRARVTYQTGGLTWWADYNLLLTPGADANTGFVDLTAWVSILNQSGASFTDARLKLVAGEVNRVAPQPAMPRLAMAMAAPQADEGFTERSFDEYHLYSLGRRTTLPANSTKQMELFDAVRRVPVQRQYLFQATPGEAPDTAPRVEREYGATTRAKVQSRLLLRNAAAGGLGLPLPAGRVRVSRLDTDGSLEFIGEDIIDHTPRDETLQLRLGSAFDITGERRQTGFVLDTRGRWLEEQIEVQLRNHKREPVEVQVREVLYRTATAKLLSSSQAPQQPDARTLVFPVKVPGDGTGTVRYTVRYSW